MYRKACEAGQKVREVKASSEVEVQRRGKSDLQLRMWKDARVAVVDLSQPCGYTGWP